MANELTNQIFRFKHFSVAQDKVTMKVGTDGVLVGAWADLDGVRSALDIGTGSGLIALMLAQRIGAHADIHAIDVDENAIAQAQQNFEQAPWSKNFTLHHEAIQDFAKSSIRKFDLIISNPPFFTGGMLSENNSKNDVRHTTKLPHGDLLQAVDRLLSPTGKLTLILPYLQGLRFMEISQTYRLYPYRITEVYSRSTKPVERLLIDFTRKPLGEIKSVLNIHEEGDEFAQNYKSLTADFYLKF